MKSLLRKAAFVIACNTLGITGVVPKDQVRRRLRKMVNEEWVVTIARGTRVESKCFNCKTLFQYTVENDNQPPSIYCSLGCKKRARKKRTKIIGEAYCLYPQKNRYPDMEIARKVGNLMDGPESWKIAPYHCPAGHCHIGRVDARIIEEEE